MILDKTVTVPIWRNNKRYYQDLGYEFTKDDREIVILIEHLSPKSTIKIRFKCDRCGEIHSIRYVDLKKKIDRDKHYCRECINKMGFRKGSISFEEWCLKNSPDVLNKWDCELNERTPCEVTYKSNQWFWFKCNSNNNHESELLHLPDEIRYFDKGWDAFGCKQCNSFAQWGIENIGDKFLEEYWDYEKNVGINPFKISKAGHTQIYIKCKEFENHGSTEMACREFYGGIRCRHGTEKKERGINSFLQYHIKNTDIDFINKYWSSKNKFSPSDISFYSEKPIYIKCANNDSHPDYKTTPDNFTEGKRCPHCSHKKIIKDESVGVINPKSLLLWSDKNKKTPFDYSTHSASMVWWKCEGGIHEDYKRSVYSSTNSDYRCPECVRIRTESFLQEKVRKYLTNDLGYILLHEYDCELKCINPKTNYALPYDNQVIELGLFIETMGKQHYKPSKFGRVYNKEDAVIQLEDLKWRDEYKKNFVLSNGYYYLAIPYWTEKDESYKTLIDNKISEILSCSCVDDKAI